MTLLLRGGHWQPSLSTPKVNWTLYHEKERTVTELKSSIHLQARAMKDTDTERMML